MRLIRRSGNAYIEYLVAATGMLIAALAFANSGRIKTVGNPYKGWVSQVAK